MRRDEAAEISPSEIMAAVPSACMLHAADPDLRLAVPNACSMPLMDNMFHRHVFGEQGEGVTAPRLSSAALHFLTVSCCVQHCVSDTCGTGATARKYIGRRNFIYMHEFISSCHDLVIMRMFQTV